MRFASCSICPKYCARHEKMRLGHAARGMQNYVSKPEDLMLQIATPLRKSPLGPPNISDSCVPCIAPARRHASLQILFKCPTPAHVFETAREPLCFSHVWQGAEFLDIPCTCHAKRRFNMQKWREHVAVFAFSLRNVLRATTACTFSTSQLPNVLRATTACALFRHLNFQKWSDTGVLCTF